MKSKAAFGCVAAVLALMITPSPAPAQNAGFRAGIAQATFGFPPAQAPAVVTNSTFVAVPTVIIPHPPVLQIPTVVYLPTYPNYIPNYVLQPGQTVVQTGIPFGSPGFGPAASFGPPVAAATPQRRLPPARGTPRTEVLRQFGAPSLTVYTSSGETLYFTGGVTVIIQNGQVAGTR